MKEGEGKGKGEYGESKGELRGETVREGKG